MAQELQRVEKETTANGRTVPWHNACTLVLSLLQVNEQRQTTLHFLHLVKQVGHSDQLHTVHAQARPHTDPLFYSLRSWPGRAEETTAKLPTLQQTSGALPT
jgi:hypothetical protein